MADVAALDKHSCPACGAMANWNAAQKALVCPYCGAVSPVELASDGSVVKDWGIGGLPVEEYRRRQR